MKAADAALARKRVSAENARSSLPKQHQHQTLAGLARAYVQTGALEQAKQTLSPRSKRRIEPTVLAARARSEQAKSVEPLAELEKTTADPQNHQARPRPCGRMLKASGTTTVKHLLEIVKRPQVER